MIREQRPRSTITNREAGDLEFLSEELLFESGLRNTVREHFLRVSHWPDFTITPGSQRSGLAPQGSPEDGASRPSPVATGRRRAALPAQLCSRARFSTVGNELDLQRLILGCT